MPAALAHGLVLSLLAQPLQKYAIKGGEAAAAMRRVNKDFRAAVDAELLLLMRRLTNHLSRAALCREKLDEQKKTRNEAGEKVELDGVERELALAREIMSPCFGTLVSLQIETDIAKNKFPQTHLLHAHVGTFLAISMQRCQLKLDKSNNCVTTNLLANFTSLKLPFGTVCVYANSLDRDALLMYRTQFFQTIGHSAAEQNANALARALLRLRDVHSLSSDRQILDAMGVDPQKRFFEFFVEQHPHFTGHGMASMVSMLRITPDELECARASFAPAT